MDPHTPEPLASPSENSKSPLHPLSSSSKSCLSRQSREKKGEVAREESKMKAANSRPLPPLRKKVTFVGITRIEGGEAEMVKHPPHSQADHQHEPAQKDPHTPEPLASPSENSKSPLYPLSSSSKSCLSRQSREKKGEGAREESKMKAANSRPLPPLRKKVTFVGITIIEGGEAEMVKHPPHSQADHQHEPAQQNWPLSARERGRLRRAQENQSVSAPVVRIAPYDVASLNAKHTDHLDCPRPAGVAAVTHKEKKSSWHHSNEEKCSSSTSSTKALTTSPAFDRPSTVLIKLGNIKKVVSYLRLEVIEGLGEELLNKVLDILKEVDEDKLDVMLWQQMGEKKYKAFAVKVWLLKLLELILIQHRSGPKRKKILISFEAAPVVRIAPYDVASLNAKHTDHLDCPRPAGVAAVTHKEKKSSWHHSNEEECSSSTSSTKRSEGDYREGEIESDMMQKVRLTEKTLMEDPLCEQQKADTLPGKSREGNCDFHLSDRPSNDSSRLAKIRRAVEHLRIDLVKGLGVKLLDKALDIMKEEDKDKRDVMLRQQMGEEPYRLFIVKVWQLKFFEDI